MNHMNFKTDRTTILVRECLTKTETFFTAAISGEDEDEPSFAVSVNEEEIYEAVLRKIGELGLRLDEVKIEQVTETIG